MHESQRGYCTYIQYCLQTHRPPSIGGTLDIPTGTYPGITAALPTVGSVNLSLAAATLDAARADAFVGAMVAAGNATS